MFADFESMLKGKINSIKEAPTDISRVPQRYTIAGRQIQELKLLSEGSFGFIWLAEDTATRQKYALKRIVCITNERLQMARRELEIMMQLPKSKNLVGCFGGELVSLRCGNSQQKVLVILMEFCPNGTLFDLMEKREGKGFAEKELLQVAHAVLEGLRALHQTGTSHQDIKIENVIIGEDGCFKLCDFGSCTSRTIDFASISKTEYANIKEEMEAVTTPMYRPPEMVDPYLQLQVSNKVDLWMLGCVIYTLAYFTHPFLDANAIGIAAAVYRFPKYPQETQYQVSEKIKDLIRNLLTPNPVFRPSAADTIQILNNWHTSSEVPLNKEARRRKEEQRAKEREMAVLNKRVVDFDGDIPMEKLMELQNKLKHKEAQSETKQASFITSKETQLIKEGKAYGSQKANLPQQPNPQYSQQQGYSQAPQVRPKQQVNINSFWSPAGTQSGSNGGNKFDAFSTFFATSNEPAKKQNSLPADMYDEFFSEKPTPPPAKPASSGNQVNLLDL